MLDALSHIFSRFSVLECDFFPDYPLSRLTTLRIGGPCLLLAVPKSEEVLCELLSLLDERGIPRAILGNGSNLLAPDEGYRGVVIRTSALTEVKVTAHTVSAACGAPLSAVIKEATAHGIAGLSAALDYLEEVGINAIREKEMALMTRFFEGVKEIPGVTIYGDFSAERTAVVTLNIGDEDSSIISDTLFEDYDISTRPGAHCAPRMHEALGTTEQGAVRFSFSWFNTIEDVDAAIQAVRELAE